MENDNACFGCKLFVPRKVLSSICKPKKLARFWPYNHPTSSNPFLLISTSQTSQTEINHRIVVTPVKESKPTQHQLELTRAFAILPTASALALAACVEFVPAGTKHVKHVGCAWFEACNRTGCTSDPLALSNNTSPCLDLQVFKRCSNKAMLVAVNRGFNMHGFSRSTTLSPSILKLLRMQQLLGHLQHLWRGPGGVLATLQSVGCPLALWDHRVLELFTLRCSSFDCCVCAATTNNNKQTTNNQQQQEQQPAACNLIFVTSQIALERLPTNRPFASSVKCPSTRRP